MEQNYYEAALAFALRGIRCILVATGFALYVAALGARRLADIAGRRAERTRIR